MMKNVNVILSEWEWKCVLDTLKCSSERADARIDYCLSIIEEKIRSSVFSVDLIGGDTYEEE